ncbi:MAG: LPXTG cell wall anchor domain-containing protein [Lachnospiraceae bacterium]|nr:LPXTG cell wall anchor domain-containing protein [Lachnospiraceae bacterium]
MRNSKAKRIIAVLLCLVVFAGSELSGITNIVGELFATEMPEGDSEGAGLETASDAIEIEAGESGEDGDVPEDTGDEEDSGDETDSVIEDAGDKEDVSGVTEEENSDDGKTEETLTDGEDAAAGTENENNEENPEEENVKKQEEHPADTEVGEHPVNQEMPDDGEAEEADDNYASVGDGEEIRDEQTIIDEVTVPEETTGEEEQSWPEFADHYSDDKVKISVEAPEGVLPENVALSVTPIVKQDVEELEAQEGIAQEEIAEAEVLNAKYEDVQKELEASVAGDEEKEIAGFLAYDISFFLEDEEGEKREIEPDGNVSVSMEFEEAYLPEEIAGSDELQIDSVDVVHMKEVEDEETGETVLRAETIKDADISTTESAGVENAGFVVDSFSTFTITWTTVKGNSQKTFQIKAFCVDKSGAEILGVTQKNLSFKVDYQNQVIDLSDAKNAPAIEGYALREIRLNKTNGLQIRDLRGGWHSTQKECRIEIRQGKWTEGNWKNGKWTECQWNPTGDWINWNTEDKNIYFVYEPIEIEIPVNCVDQDGNPISAAVAPKPLTLRLKSGERTDLTTYFSKVEGYTLQSIQLYDAGGARISYLESTTTDNRLKTERGDWKDGKWASNGEGQITCSRPTDGLYVKYASIVTPQDMEIAAYCVDKYGNPIAGAEEITLELKNIGLETPINLQDYAPDLTDQNYALRTIRLNAMSSKDGIAVKDLKGGRSNSNSNVLCLRRQKGSWTGGKRENGTWIDSTWNVDTEDQRWFEWTTDQKAIYFIYEPTEFRIPVFCVERNGNALSPTESSMTELVLQAGIERKVNLQELAPGVEGYTLHSIRRTAINGTAVNELYTDTVGDLWRKEGDWSSGAWVPSGSENDQRWTANPKSLCFIYEPAVATIPVVCIDQKTGNPLSVNAAPLKLTGVDSILNLQGYAPHIEGYSLSSIRAESANGIEIDRLQSGLGNDGKYSISYAAASSNGDFTPWTAAEKKVYMLYEPITPAEIIDPGESGDDAPAPDHRKYIKYNEDTKDYTLTLNVTGRRNAAKPIDILLIVDLSNSMKDDHEEENLRYENLNSALGELKSALTDAAQNDENLSIELGVVTFNSSGMPDITTDESQVGGDKVLERYDWTYNSQDKRQDAEAVAGWYPLDQFNWTVTAEMCKGATNWQAGIQKGEAKLGDADRADHRKYVIFLTDGNPTCRYLAGSSTITVGNGGDDPYGNNYNAALNEWMQSSQLRSAAARFVIDANENPVNDCAKFAEAIKAEELSGLSAEDMSNSFRQIAGEIIYPGYTDVSITDMLSTYVEFMEENPSIQVMYQGKEDAEPKELKGADGEPLYTCKVDKSKKTVSVALLNGGKLADGTTYSISFKVQPTQAAREEYAKTGYPHTGDPTTDAPDNDTSSGKPGFHSNADESAKVHYKYNEGELKDADYLHPVVQVEKPDENHAGLTKTMGTCVTGTDGKIQYPITLRVTTRQKLINGMYFGSSGDGWTVYDKMADYTQFVALNGAVVNGHKLELSDGGRKLICEPDAAADSAGKSGRALVTKPIVDANVVAEYIDDGSGRGEIRWYLRPKFAEVKEGSDGGNPVKDYTYTLTYYVRFEDSGQTELRNTNAYTYVTIPGRDEKLYPERMPYFINVVGRKTDTESNQLLSGAEFNVYRNADRTETVAAGITSDENGHFAFQIGESDLAEGAMTVYLEESKAPDGYVKDETLHPITITASGISYEHPEGHTEGKQIWSSGDVKSFGSVVTDKAVLTLAHPLHDAEDDLLEVTSSEELTLHYRNPIKSSWAVVKRSRSNQENYLSGAEFQLYAVTGDTTASVPSYTGTSDANGMISQWTPAAGGAVTPELIPAGTYELHESKAPAGYALSEEVWIITISEKGAVTVKVKNTVLSPTEVGGTFCYYFEDDVLYELPSTGGAGIYWYTISGTLLMIAGMLVLYKKKYAGRC